MKTYPRFQIYELFNDQNDKCYNCKSFLNIHDLEVENITNNKLFCNKCILPKHTIIEDLDNQNSLLELDLRPLSQYDYKMYQNDKIQPIQTVDHAFADYHFEKPFEYNFDISPPLSPTSSTMELEQEADIDPEEKIQSSWFHRSMLGDENRQAYDDGEDIDFELAVAVWDEIHGTESDEEDWFRNSRVG